MRKLITSKIKYILGIVIILLYLFTFFKEQPLTKMLHTDKIESNVQVYLSRYDTVKEYNKVTTVHKYYIIDEDTNSKAIQELINVLEDIPARNRPFLPFEKVTIIHSGYDNLSIDYIANGKEFNINLMEDFSTLYETGSTPYKAYSVGLEAFEKIAGVIEKYGEVEEYTPKDLSDEA